MSLDQGSALSRAPAGDADAGVDVRYRLAASPPLRVCVGTDNVLSVSVVRAVTAVQTNTPELVGGTLTENMPDVVIDAQGGNPVIELKDTTRVTWLDGSHDPPTANFRFHAKQAGSTTVRLVAHISAMADFGWRGVLEDSIREQPITVVNCKFMVHAFARFRLAGEAKLTFAYEFSHVPLEASADGEFRQSARVTWVAGVSRVGDCLGRAAARTSEAAIFATLDADGTLTVDIKYEPFAFKLAGNCGGFSTAVTPSALHFEVGPQVGQLDQELTSPLGGVPGAARYSVTKTDSDGP